MIKFTENKNDIIKLWQEAFGDSEEDILFFINNVKNAKCLAYYDNNSIASMLYLVDSSKGKYVYAACTLKEYRGKGYMSDLLSYCKNQFDAVCLIPANEGLIEYYKNRGLNIELDIKEIKFNETDEIVEYLFEGCELSNPIVLMYKGE